MKLSPKVALMPKVLVIRLKGTPFSYVAYSFSKEYRVFVETSFPNKVSISMKNGLPILFHGPSYASVAKFVEKYEAGIVLDSMDLHQIAGRLAAISASDLEHMRAECLRAASERFNTEVICRSWLSNIRELQLAAGVA